MFSFHIKLTMQYKSLINSIQNRCTEQKVLDFFIECLNNFTIIYGCMIQNIKNKTAGHYYFLLFTFNFPLLCGLRIPDLSFIQNHDDLPFIAFMFSALFVIGNFACYIITGSRSLQIRLRGIWPSHRWQEATLWTTRRARSKRWLLDEGGRWHYTYCRISRWSQRWFQCGGEKGWHCNPSAGI